MRPAALTALALAASCAACAPALAATRTVTCRGTDRSCVATVSLAGGASNVRLVVELSGTDLRLTGRSVTPAIARGAYSITGARFRLGGSEWVATLNAVGSLPRGARLRLAFATPPQAAARSFTAYTYGPVQYIDAGAPGRGLGDVYTFSSVLYAARNQPPTGRSYGDIEVVDAVDQPGETREVRLFRQVFSFDGRGTIVVQGLNEAVPPDGALVPASTSVRAVVGGTGEFAGVRGEVATTRIGDSAWYRQRFTLRP